MEFVAALPSGLDQPGGLQHGKVLGDRLARDAELVLHAQPGANLEQSLPLPHGEFVEDRPTRRVGQGFEEFVGHVETICKYVLACQFVV